MSHGFTATQCTLQYVVTHPGTGVSIIGWTLHDLPGTIASQPRAYDGLPSDGGTPPLPNMQWYTPLMAWWLPQRTLLFGFAAAISVLLLVLAGASSNGPSWEPFALAGVLIGLLPIVHVQTLIALSILLFVLLWRRRRREWFYLLGIAVLIGSIRFAQLALSQHGAAVTPYGTNVYPWLEPGWMANAGTAAGGPSRPLRRQSLQRSDPGDGHGGDCRAGGDSGSQISGSRCHCLRLSPLPWRCGLRAAASGAFSPALFQCRCWSSRSAHCSSSPPATSSSSNRGTGTTPSCSCTGTWSSPC